MNIKITQSEKKRTNKLFYSDLEEGPLIPCKLIKLDFQKYNNRNNYYFWWSFAEDWNNYAQLPQLYIFINLT